MNLYKPIIQIGVAVAALILMVAIIFKRHRENKRLSRRLVQTVQQLKQV